MTCIVGLAVGGRVYIGGDSAGLSDWSLTLHSGRKVFRNGPAIIGFTASLRMGQLLAHALVIPERSAEQSVQAYMSTTFADAVRDCLQRGGYYDNNNSDEREGSFLVGIEGRLFSVFSDYSVAEDLRGMNACGCARDVALGALYASATLPPERRIRIALEAAEQFSGGVRGPFCIEVSA